MASNRPPRPTDSELTLLRVLWQRGPSTVREVLEFLPETAGYTTVLKLLQIMTVKGLVLRDTSERTHIYRPAIPQEATQKMLLQDLIIKAFNGSAKQLVLHALSSEEASACDMEEIRRLLNKSKKEGDR